MSVKSIARKSAHSRTEWKRLRRMRDRDIDFSDTPETDAQFWADAELFLPPAKTHLSVRLDEDVVKWFKRQGPGYQTRMNAVLRAYVRSKLNRSA